MTLGERLREIRERSAYPRRKDFASHVGLSSEGLRKIEADRRVPALETIDRILEVGGVPIATSSSVRRSWASAIAMREGIDFDELKVTKSSQSAIDRIGGSILSSFVAYVDICDGELSEDWEEDFWENHLKGILTQGLKDEFEIQVEGS